MYGFFWSSHSFVLFIIIFSSFFFSSFLHIFLFPPKKRRPPGPAFLGVALGQVLIRPLGRPLAFPWNDEKKSQFLVRNFYVGNTGNLRNFYVEIASGYCQWNSVLGPIGQTDSAIVHGTGAVRTHFDCFIKHRPDWPSERTSKRVSE